MVVLLVECSVMGEIMEMNDKNKGRRRRREKDRRARDAIWMGINVWIALPYICRDRGYHAPIHVCKHTVFSFLSLRGAPADVSSIDAHGVRWMGAGGGSAAGRRCITLQKLLDVFCLFYQQANYESRHAHKIVHGTLLTHDPVSLPTRRKIWRLHNPWLTQSRWNHRLQFVIHASQYKCSDCSWLTPSSM